jgi:hypothetical protein
MANDWYFSREGQSLAGPCTSTEIRRLASIGQLLPGDLVAKNRKVRLVRAASVKGLFPASAADKS